jgi:adenylosuccinate lyase
VRQAYEWVQRNALKAWDEGQDLKSLVSSDDELLRALRGRYRASVLTRHLPENIDKVFARVFA